MYSLRKATRRRPKNKTIAAELLDRIGEANRIVLGIAPKHAIASSTLSGGGRPTNLLAREKSQ